jgi:hypothetical protein
VHKSRCAKLLLQPILHEVDYIGGSFILNTTQHLDSGNTNQFDEFQKLMVEYGRFRNFVPKLCKKVELVFFLQN